MTERQGDKPPVVSIRDFSGMISNADEEDLPPGAMTKQVNMHSPRQGLVQVRQGLRVVTFDG